MKISQIPLHSIIELNYQTHEKNAFDIKLNHFQKLKKEFSAFECHIILYPYHRNISSKNFKFHPFEEYISDIARSQQSVYVKISDKSPRIFGFMLAVLISVVFALFYPSGLLSIEAIVSIFGAYTIGKEIYTDIERALIKISRRWRLKFADNFYSFQLLISTLTRYSNLAKKHRFEAASVLPVKLDFVELSNSQTVRMYFSWKGLESFNEEWIRLLTVKVDETNSDLFYNPGFLLGLKLIFNKKRFGFTKGMEVYQSIHNNTFGCLDTKDNWIEKAVLYRKHWHIGRLKYEKKTVILPDMQTIKF